MQFIILLIKAQNLLAYNSQLSIFINMEFTVQQIADYLKGTVEGDGTLKVSELSKIEEGRPGTLTFLSTPKYTQYIDTTQASA